MSAKKNPYKTPEAEALAAKIFGKHMPVGKQKTVAVATLAVCLLPVALGLRLWDVIPETIETGLKDFAGNDDSLPRTVAVFGLPALFLVLNAIAHAQLHLFQKRGRLPPGAIRMFGRWGMPALSLLICGSVQLRAAGKGLLNVVLLYPTVIGYAVMMFGSSKYESSRLKSFALLGVGFALIAGAVLFAGL